MARQPAALGIKTRTGRAILVALRGPAGAPEIVAKGRIDVATTFDEGAVFHMGQEMPLGEARAFIEASEQRFVARASAELRAFAARAGVEVAGAGMAAPAAKSLPALEAVLKTHALVHAAEGELYRRVFAAAAAALGAPPLREPADALAGRVGAALGLAPAKVLARLAAMGKASGRPWAADQKEAALAGWLALSLCT